jgi:uncharacterized protein YkvS
VDSKNYLIDLLSYINDFLKNYSSIISVIQGLVSIVILSILQCNKSKLNKIEIRFSKYNELQIEALNSIYKHITINRNNIASLVNSKSSYTYLEYKQAISSCFINLNKTSSKFSSDKLLLTKNLKSLYSKDLAAINNFRNLLINERGFFNSIEYKYETVEDYFEYDEIEKVKLRQSLIIKKSEEMKIVEILESLRKEIEKEFEKSIT